MPSRSEGHPQPRCSLCDLWFLIVLPSDNSPLVLTQTQCECTTAHLSFDLLIIYIEVTYNSLFSGIQWSPSPPDFDFWKEAEKLGKKAIDFADINFTESALQFPAVADRIVEFKASVQDLVKSAEALAPQGSLVARTDININPDEFIRRLSDKIDIILEELKAGFSEPLPEDRSEGYKKREEAVDRALDKLEGAFVEVYEHWHVPEVEAKERFSHVKAPIRRVVLLVGE